MFRRILIWTIQNSTTTQIADTGDVDIACQWKIASFETFASLSSEEKTPCHGWLKRTICLPILLQTFPTSFLIKTDDDVPYVPSKSYIRFGRKVSSSSPFSYRRSKRANGTMRKKKNERARLSFFREISFPFLLGEKIKTYACEFFFNRHNRVYKTMEQMTVEIS